MKVRLIVGLEDIRLGEAVQGETGFREKRERRTGRTMAVMRNWELRRRSSWLNDTRLWGTGIIYRWRIACR